MKLISMLISLFTIVMLISTSHVHSELTELKLSVINIDLKTLIERTLIHELIVVDRGEDIYINISVVKDTRIFIGIYELYYQEIDIEIIRPDGSLELPEIRVREFRYEFIATMSGKYMIRLDNTFDRIFRKYVKIAIEIDAPPRTVTVTKVPNYTSNITSPYTITETETITHTVTRVDWITTSTAFNIALVIGVVMGYFLCKAGKK